MKKKLVFSSLAVLVFALWVPAQAAQQARIPKIGQLSTSSLGASGRREFLGRELPPLGYVIGKNIAIEFRHADNKLDRLPALAEELVGLKVDVLVVGTTPGALAAKNATRTIP
ncbi:MAG: ABC transporter substrate-binding protein, partial [Candidatus Binatia bacterium]